MLNDFLAKHTQVLFAPEGAGSGAGSESSPGGALPSPAPAAPSSSPSGASSSPTPSATPPGTSEPTGSTQKDVKGPTPSSSPPTSEPTSASNPFDEMFSYLSGEEPVEVAAEPQTKPTEKPAEAKPEAKPTTEPQAPVEVKPTAEQKPESAPAQGQPEASPPLTPAEPGKLAQALLDQQAELLPQIAEQLFAMSDEDVEALQSDPQKSLPMMASRVYVRAVSQALKHMEAAIPAAIERHMRVTESSRKSEEAFYKAWPDLDPAQHGPLVKRLGMTYRMTNPTSPMSQMIEELGPMVMMAAKVQPKPIVASPGAPAPAVNGVRPPQASPFVPAIGGPAASSPQGQAGSEWGYLDPNQQGE